MTGIHLRASKSAAERRVEGVEVDATDYIDSAASSSLSSPPLPLPRPRPRPRPLPSLPLPKPPRPPRPSPLPSPGGPPMLLFVGLRDETGERVDSLAATALLSCADVCRSHGWRPTKLCRAGAAADGVLSSPLLAGEQAVICSLELATRRVFCNTARLAQTQPSRKLLLQKYVTGRCGRRLNAKPSPKCAMLVAWLSSGVAK